MKIAITSTGPTLEDNVSTEFADSRYLLIVDFDTLSYEAVISPVIADDSPAAGRLLAQHLWREGVSKILANHSNPEVLQSFLETLRGTEIQIVGGMSGSVRSAVRQFKQLCMADTVIIPCEDILDQEFAA
jgi:predicted Fe-Mo cluster-binding NifX family protein